MSKPEISIILPGIRRELWDRFYESISISTKRTFELIIVGPYPLTEKLESLTNVKYVKDFGSPVRASNIAASICEGKVITWCADDSWLLEDSIDKHVDMLYEMGPDIKNVVVAKYYEGQEGTKDRTTLQPDSYYLVNNADCTRSAHIPDDWWIFNAAYLYREFFEDLGGWDCKFEATAMAHTDFAIRAQFMGAKVKMSGLAHVAGDHMPGGTGDHMPIFMCQTQNDEPLIQSKYRDPNWTTNVNMKIDLNNWKNAPSVWTRRFKNEI